MGADARAADAVVATVAARQHGVVTGAQLLRAGLSSDAIRHRVERGRLHRVYRGVYAVGHPAVSATGRLVAALAACGAGAHLSHRTAAQLWGLRDRTPTSATIDVTVAGRCPRSRAGIRVHRVRVLDADDRRRHAGIPLTAPARTLLDLAALVGAGELEEAYERARTLRLAGPQQVRAAMERAPRRPGSGALRSLVDERPSLTRSTAERRLLDLVSRGGLPRPQTNVRVAGHEVDMLWRTQRVIVEVDGYAFHGGRTAFERDRGRDIDLQLAGHQVLRLTWRRIVDEPEVVLVALARALR